VVKVEKRKCNFCETIVLATDDDMVPTCEPCQGVWAEALIIEGIMKGEMKHLFQDEDEEEDED
jgi:hypothetical protein